jgi:hypothetical protein
MKKIIPLLIALVAILFLWIFFSKEEPKASATTTISEFNFNSCEADNNLL